MNFEQKNNRNDGEKKRAMNRREFLKNIGAAGAGFLAGHTLNELVKSFTEEDLANTKELGDDLEIPEKEVFESFELFSETSLDLKSLEALKDYWKKRYEDPEDKGVDLAIALRRLQSIDGRYQFDLDERIRDIFREENVPEKYRFIAFPESHWYVENRSDMGARGPYQFVVSTGEDYGLIERSGSQILRDDRSNPIKSARAAAKHIRDDYERLGDWQLALWGYNGGFVKRYALEARNKDEEISVSGFMKYMENNINRIRDEIINAENPIHKVTRGENLYRISQKYGTTVEKIKELNNLKEDTIRTGQELTIPPLSNSAKKALFRERIAGILENINYVPRFEAIAEILKDMFHEDSVTKHRLAE